MSETLFRYGAHMPLADIDPESLDTDAIRERYRIERDKRMRADGNAQYVSIEGVYKDYDQDPYVEPGFTREPIVEHVDVVVIGGGFGGMLSAAQLRMQGVDSFKIIEKGGDFGGTWYWNRYPGAACDVESYSYLPLLEATGYMPTEKYAKATEIFAYCQVIAKHFELYPNAMFQTEVLDAAWDDEQQRWIVATSRNDVITARYVVIAGGVLHKAKLPGIAGIETFAGHSFHTSRWDYAYTGGGPMAPLDNLGDKRVGIIGTGATAVQAVPNLAKGAQHLYVFQRTPSSVGVRNNRPTDPEWFSSLQPGWQRNRVENFTAAITGKQPEVDLVQDGWTELLWIDTKKNPSTPEEAAELERIDFRNMEALRHRIDDVIDDAELAEKLKPWYNQMCKRPCFHDEYLPSFNRPNVTLVDTDGKGVQQITPAGVLVDGVEYELDCLVFASGFEVTTDYWHRLGFDPRGRAGVPLSAAWEDGPATLHGVFTRGFPNLLMLSTVQGGQATNFVHTITAISEHIGCMIRRCLDDGVATVEPTAQAQDDWFQVLFAAMLDSARYTSLCTPGYLNNEGALEAKSAKAAPYLGSAIEFVALLEAWRAEGNLVGLERSFEASA